MPHRLLAIKYKSQDCLVHLFYNMETIQVNLLDKILRDDLNAECFSVGKDGSLFTGSNCNIQLAEEALGELIALVREQQDCTT